MQGKAWPSPPGCPPRHLLIIVNCSVNWFAYVQRSTCTSCHIQSHANPNPVDRKRIQRVVTSQNLWPRHDRHFVGISWHNVWS